MDDGLQEARDAFNALLVKKQASQHANSNCKGVFARVWQSDIAVLNQLEETGVLVVEAEDVHVDRIPPYAKVGRGNPAVPSFKVWFCLDSARVQDLHLHHQLKEVGD